MTSERRPVLKIIPVARPIARPGFEDVLVEHHDSLYRTAVRLIRHREKAEDLVRDTCLRAFRGYDQLEHPGNARRRLFTILLNTITNEAKKPKAELVDIEMSEALLAPSPLCAYDQQAVFRGLMDDEV